MLQPFDDTICGVATPLGEGGIGIIRVSGKDALAIASKLVRLRSRKALNTVSSHHMNLADIVVSTLDEHGKPSDEIIDEAMVVTMKGPRSFTGEDVVEIHAHGGPLILQSICQALVKNQSRLAEPGEFTKRAFLNGRLDLTQAEAVLDTIKATTEKSLKAAQCQLRGGLKHKVDQLRDQLIKILAHLEAGLDFVEEDITFIQANEIREGLQAVENDITQLLESYQEGRILRDGIRVAIIGRPNVGKSSLLNALLDADRAIVSSIPGTTRDIIDEVLNIRGIPVRLIDTAGFRDTPDSIEEEGIRRTRDAVDQADLVLVVLDGSEILLEADRQIIQEYAGRRLVVLLNKCDLSHQFSLEKFQDEWRHLDGKESPQDQQEFKVIRISAKHGIGLDLLRDTIGEFFLRKGFEVGHSELITQLRHKEALHQAVESIHRAIQSGDDSLSGEFIALDIRGSLDGLGQITGTISQEDILDKIFKDFCIGK